ncbi:stage IV sporulation protein FB [Alkalihalobacillus xiaoxiensis]|uniref:Stage IV sporulation protein FB n=1 Tax=Shouchella xiaoxiensis TaxID=766895 RepID=A0ABS2SWG9_9BACI|nr:M50 family metallopeptidase [Shouchella xiaoxiensis]MBM7838587.1 stage IV sporulation protein FB [Shouchella xiaoxiensis]
MIKIVTKIRIHPLFWLIIGLGVLTGRFKEVLMILTIVFIHEMGHAWMAHFFGWKVIKIELMPFGGAAEVEPGGIRPLKEELLIVLFGPLQHFWLLGLSFMLVETSFWSIADHQLFIGHNLAILLFNLLPIYPLDGGRLVQLFLFQITSFKRASAWSLYLSCTCLLLSLCFISFFPLHLNLVIIFLFLCVAQFLEFKQRNYRFIRFLMTKKEDVTSKKTVTISVEAHQQLNDVVAKFKRHTIHRIFIRDQENVVEVDEKKLLSVYFTKGIYVPVKTLI